MELGLDITATTQQAVPLHTPGGARNARADQPLDATAAAQGTSPDAILSRRIRTIPSGRAGAIDDIAGAVCFLVSERAGYVNGAALVVDGSRSVLT